MYLPNELSNLDALLSWYSIATYRLATAQRARTARDCGRFIWNVLAGYAAALSSTYILSNYTTHAKTGLIR